MKTKIRKIEVNYNVWGPAGQDLAVEDHASPSEFSYSLVLYYQTEFPPILYTLKRAVHPDLSEARLIASHIYQVELDWLTIQDTDILEKRKLGIMLIFHPTGEKEKDLVVESSFEDHADLTKDKREKEKSIFQNLGKEYPERNFRKP